MLQPQTWSHVQARWRSGPHPVEQTSNIRMLICIDCMSAQLRHTWRPSMSRTHDTACRPVTGPGRYLDVLGCSRLDKHTCAVLYSPSDDDLLRNTPALLANLPDDGVLHMQNIKSWNTSHTTVYFCGKLCLIVLKWQQACLCACAWCNIDLGMGNPRQFDQAPAAWA